MSRSGYNEDWDGNHWDFIRWRGAVKSAFRGKRGQAFLKELLAALDALPEPKLVEGELEKDGQVCALGAVGRARGMNMTEIDPYDYDVVSGKFNVAGAMAREIMYLNDESFAHTPEERFRIIRGWIASEIKQ